MSHENSAVITSYSIHYTKLYEAKSAYEGLLAVADGSSDAYLGEYLPTSYLADVHHLGRIRAVASTDLTKNFVFVGHKNMTPVINVIDKIITSIV